MLDIYEISFNDRSMFCNPYILHKKIITEKKEFLNSENLFSTKCKICFGEHDNNICPQMHPLNRQQMHPLNRQQKKPIKFIGPTCRWCHGKHLGVNCPDRELHRELQTKHEGAYAASVGIKFHDNPYRRSQSNNWLYSAWEYGYINNVVNTRSIKYGK